MWNQSAAQNYPTPTIANKNDASQHASIFVYYSQMRDNMPKMFVFANYTIGPNQHQFFVSNAHKMSSRVAKWSMND